MKIAITGATGMIGATLAAQAADNGHGVLCLIRKNSPKEENIPNSDKIAVEYCDISGYGGFASDKRYDVFFHLAWADTFGAFRDDVDSQLQNIRYTLDAVRLAKRLGCKKFVGAGSQAEYGIVSEPLKSDTPANPLSGYGIAKYAAGRLSRLLCCQLGLEFNWVRILSVYGHLDRTQSLIMHTIRELQAGRSPELTKCDQIWDYLYCDDAAGALLAIGEKGADGKTYPLGSGNGKKLSGYLEVLRDAVAPDISLDFGKKEYYPHQPVYLCADISELMRDTQWRPAVSFGDGIQKILKRGDF